MKITRFLFFIPLFGLSGFFSLYASSFLSSVQPKTTFYYGYVKQNPNGKPDVVFYYDSKAHTYPSYKTENPVHPNTIINNGPNSYNLGNPQNKTSHYPTTPKKAIKKQPDYVKASISAVKTKKQSGFDLNIGAGAKMLLPFNKNYIGYDFFLDMGHRFNSIASLGFHFGYSGIIIPSSDTDSPFKTAAVYVNTGVPDISKHPQFTLNFAQFTTGLYFKLNFGTKFVGLISYAGVGLPFGLAFFPKEFSLSFDNHGFYAPKLYISEKLFLSFFYVAYNFNYNIYTQLKGNAHEKEESKLEMHSLSFGLAYFK